MAKRYNLIQFDVGELWQSFSLAWYEEPVWGYLSLGLGRFSLNLWKLSLIIECWWWKGRHRQDKWAYGSGPDTLAGDEDL